MKYRKHIRLYGYDYSGNGYYFITLCTSSWQKLFEPRISKHYGHELSPNVVATPWPALKSCVAAGASPANFKENSDIVEHNLNDLERKFALELDFYCLMPDHIHLTLFLNDDFVTESRKITALPWIINAFKGWCTRKFGKPVWQPNFYEHIIRNEQALDKIRKYILNNPNIEYEDINWGRLDG